MSSPLRYLATIELLERRAKIKQELDSIVAAVERGNLSPSIAMIKIAAIKAKELI